MSTYRTGNHLGVTIVREGEHGRLFGLDAGPAHDHPDCRWPDERCHGHPDEAAEPDQLVAVVVNGDTALAERICALLNGRNDLQTAMDALVANRNLWQRRALDAGWQSTRDTEVGCTAETRSWDHFTPEQADSYWIRCTLSGPHDEHKDEHTGLTWRSEAKP